MKKIVPLKEYLPGTHDLLLLLLLLLLPLASSPEIYYLVSYTCGRKWRKKR